MKQVTGSKRPRAAGYGEVVLAITALMGCVLAGLPLFAGFVLVVAVMAMGLLTARVRVPATVEARRKGYE